MFSLGYKKWYKDLNWECAATRQITRPDPVGVFIDAAIPTELMLSRHDLSFMGADKQGSSELRV